MVVPLRAVAVVVEGTAFLPSSDAHAVPLLAAVGLVVVVMLLLLVLLLNTAAAVVAASRKLSYS